MKLVYHYLTCGLKNVWLRNGYHIRKTPYGNAVSIEDLDGLHALIGSSLINEKPHLTGPEFRFLRKELDMSQKRIADVIGVEAQTVALWEKRSRIPKPADHWIRIIYREYVEGNARIVEAIDKLNDLDRNNYNKKKRAFQQQDGIWQRAA